MSADRYESDRLARLVSASSGLSFQFRRSRSAAASVDFVVETSVQPGHGWEEYSPPVEDVFSSDFGDGSDLVTIRLPTFENGHFYRLRVRLR